MLYLHNVLSPLPWTLHCIPQNNTHTMFSQAKIAKFLSSFRVEDDYINTMIDMVSSIDPEFKLNLCFVTDKPVPCLTATISDTRDTGSLISAGYGIIPLEDSELCHILCVRSNVEDMVKACIPILFARYCFRLASGSSRYRHSMPDGLSYHMMRLNECNTDIIGDMLNQDNDLEPTERDNLMACVIVACLNTLPEPSPELIDILNLNSDSPVDIKIAYDLTCGGLGTYIKAPEDICKLSLDRLTEYFNIDVMIPGKETMVCPTYERQLMDANIYGYLRRFRE